MKDRSLKREMSEAFRGDRERADARRKAEAEGAYVGPAPPALDLNKPTRDWKLPERAELAAVEPEGEVEEPAQPEPPEPEDELLEVQPERELETEQEPPPEDTTGVLARLRAFFRG